MNTTAPSSQSTDRRRVVAPGGGYFQAITIDELPQLLDDSYRLRYQVFGVERQFLRAADYPDGLDMDEFDRHSVHVGAVDTRDTLAGTARVVTAMPLHARPHALVLWPYARFLFGMSLDYQRKFVHHVSAGDTVGRTMRDPIT